MSQKTAVVLLNLGGPDCQEAVEPFLFNLFSDPAIISLPNPFRYWLARLISKRRTPEAQEIYAHMGGASPILENTLKQVRALQGHFQGSVRIFPVMRYWHPRAQGVVDEILAWGAEKIIFLPLYPQYSTTTTESSYLELRDLLREKKFQGSSQLICCYARHPLWIRSVQDLIEKSLKSIPPDTPYRLIFSAHGLPERVIKKGDPYQHQIESTAHDVVTALDIPGLDWLISYQSRVGPLAWIGPATDQEIIRAGREGLGIVLVPIAFVSEHSETLVELDIQYKQLAQDHGVSLYRRVATVGDHPDFIQALADLINRSLLLNQKVMCPSVEGCQGKFKKCGGRFA